MILQAAHDRHNGEIKVEAILSKDGNREEDDAHIAAIYGESIFHDGGQLEIDWLKNEYKYLDLGVESPEKIREEVMKPAGSQ